MAVAQIKGAIAAILETKSTIASCTMEPETDQYMASAHGAESQPQLDIPSIIADLKHELASIFIETHALIHQSLLLLPNHHLPSKT